MGGRPVDLCENVLSSRGEQRGAIMECRAEIYARVIDSFVGARAKIPPIEK